MFPYKDENPTILTPVVTVGIIAANLAAWLFVQGAGTNEAVLRSVCQLGLIPGEVLGRVPVGTAIPLGRDALGRLLACPNPIGPPHVATVLTSMFMHAGWLHILGNMWFLWIFGDNVERRFGSLFYLLFYLGAGIVASFAQIWAAPISFVPNLGASVAIAGVLGAYLAMFPTNRVTIVAFRFIPFPVPAIVAIGIWAVLQFISGFGQIAATDQGGGVAYLAH